MCPLTPSWRKARLSLQGESALSSRGLGRSPLKAKTGVRIPIGSLERQDWMGQERTGLD